MIWPKQSKTPSTVRRLEKRILQLEAELEAAERTIKIVESERDNLALVLARDRQRIEAELAAYARHKAEAEGVERGRIDTGLRHIG